MPIRWSSLSVLLILLTLSCSNPELPVSRQPERIAAGTIALNPELKDKFDPLSVLFVIARSPEGQMIAVKKMLPPFHFPVKFELSLDDVMVQGTAVPERLKLSARLDRDGVANPPAPGDVLGEMKDLISRGSAENRLSLEKLVP